MGNRFFNELRGWFGCLDENQNLKSEIKKSRHNKNNNNGNKKSWMVRKMMFCNKDGKKYHG